jgi:MFS family permease
MVFHFILRLANILWIVSFPVFLVALVLTYTLLEETVRIPIENGNVAFLNKEYYFYVVIAVMILMNLVLYIFRRLPENMPQNLLPIPEKKYWFANKKNHRAVIKRIKNWFSGIGFIINLFFAWIVFYIYQINTPAPWQVSWLVLIVAVLFIVWVLIYVPAMRDKDIIEEI